MNCRADCLCEPVCLEDPGLHDGACCDCYEADNGVCCRNCCK